jgi:2-methylisocitrate lyase-like PEP mutase family enzyme
MRELLRDEKVLVSVGVYDGYSARLAEQMGFQCASTTGAGVVNTRLGQPDVGIMGLLENVEACRHIARSVRIPVMADADTGYGNAVTVYHAVEYFEEAGVVGVNLEDQVWPKRCGHMRGKEIIEPREMAMKIEAACKARKDADFIINARTDAVAIEGIDGAIRRAKLYVEAGADMVYPDAIHSEEQIRRFCGEMRVPVSINMGFGIRSRPTTPLVPVKRLAEYGVKRVTLPRMLPAAALAGMKQAMQLMLQSVETGEVIDRPDLLASIEDITSLMDYDRIARLESEFMLAEQLERKYGGADADYVIRSH